MAKYPKLGAEQENWTEQQAAEMTAAAKDAVEKWVSKRTSSARAFIDVCAAVVAFTDAKVKPTKEQDKAYWRALGNPSNFTKSAWRTIGGYADVLRPHVQHLPTAQEAIKELARAEKKQAGAIDKLMTELNENSSVGDVRQAVRPYLGQPAVAPTSDTHTAVIRSKKIEQVVAIIKNALTANDAINISFADDKVLADKVISSLGKWTYNTGNAARLVIDGEYPHNPLVGFETSGKMSRLIRMSEDYEGKLLTAVKDATRKLCKQTYEKALRRETSAVKKTYKGLFNKAGVAWFRKEMKKRMGDIEWDEIDYDAIGHPDQLDRWYEDNEGQFHSGTFPKLTEIRTAVATAQAKIKEPKALAKLQAEYDELSSKSPKLPLEIPDLPRRGLQSTLRKSILKQA